MSEINQGIVSQALSILFYDIQSITWTLGSLIRLTWDYKYMPPLIFLSLGSGDYTQVLMFKMKALY